MQVKDLKQDRRNYRKHNQRNLDLIKKSVNEVGFGRSIVVNSENEIICGNGISSTLDKDTKLRVVETDGTELIVVKRNDLKTGDLKQTKLGIFDNSTSDSSEFDFELLQADFDTEELEDWGLDVDFEMPSLMNELEEGAFTKKFQEATDIFAVTFNFPKEYEVEFGIKLKTIPKEQIVEQILRYMEII